MRIVAIFFSLFFSLPGQAAERLLVFAPSSLTGTIGKIATAFTAEKGLPVKVSIAGTAQLARQIEAGAPADVVISADIKWMDWLKDRQLLSPEVPPSIVAGNNLVVAVRRETENWADIERLLTESRFAMAEPEAIPAGRYAREALISRGWWERAKTNASYGENVRVTLRRLVLGEVEAAIVYSSDLQAEPGVRAALTFGNDEHSPILTYAALTVDASKQAPSFLTFLSGEKARSILLKAGFTAPPE